LDGALNGIPWTPEELASLEAIAGSTYTPKVIETYNRWAKRAGFPVRTKSAVLNACSRNKISRQAEGCFLTSGKIAEILDVAIDIPQRWAERSYVPTIHSGKHCDPRFFRRSDLVKLAKEQPELFGGIERDRLFLLLEDADLADSIAARFPRRKGSGTAVQAIESGRIFPSVRAAAKALYVTPQGIHSAMRINGTCAGYHWRRIDPTQFNKLCQTTGARFSPQRQDSSQRLVQMNGLMPTRRN
jgi:hypothetical protein